MSDLFGSYRKRTPVIRAVATTNKNADDVAALTGWKLDKSMFGWQFRRPSSRTGWGYETVPLGWVVIAHDDGTFESMEYMQFRRTYEECPE